MRRSREWLLIAAVAIAAGAAGYGYNAWRTTPDVSAASADGNAAMPTAMLPDLDGKLQSLDQWRGKVVVVNFWATWCAPCREEIPLFVKLQEKYGAEGLQLVSIAIDQPEKVRPFAAEFRINYPILIGGLEGLNLARAMGNRTSVLPYTVVVARDGKVVSREVGAVKEARFEPLIQALLSASHVKSR